MSSLRSGSSGDIGVRDPRHAAAGPGPKGPLTGVVIAITLVAAVAGAWWILQPDSLELPKGPIPVTLKRNGVIVFECGESWPSNSELCSVEPDGSSLSTIATGSDLHDPSWSPDGKRLLFNEGGGMDEFDGASISVIDFEKGERTELIGGGGSINRFPDWSPDGRFFVFSRGEIQGGGNYNGEDDLYVADPAGDRLSPLTDSAEVEWYPAWSPDRLTIAYIGFSAGVSDLYTIRLADRAITRVTVTPSLEIGPQWSPDGSRIAFVRQYHDRDFRDQVIVIRPDGTDQRAPFTCEAECKQLLSVAWSPDGTQLVAAVSVSGDGYRYKGELYVMSPRGEDVRVLTDNARAGCCVSWQPVPE